MFFPPCLRMVSWKQEFQRGFFSLTPRRPLNFLLKRTRLNGHILESGFPGPFCKRRNSNAHVMRIADIIKMKPVLLRDKGEFRSFSGMWLIYCCDSTIFRLLISLRTSFAIVLLCSIIVASEMSFLPGIF